MTESVQLQDPGEALNYSLDWTTYLNGDTIASSSWAFAPNSPTPAPTLSGQGHDTTTTSVTVSAIVWPKVYLLQNTIVTGLGVTATRGLEIRAFRA